VLCSDGDRWRSNACGEFYPPPRAKRCRALALELVPSGGIPIGRFKHRDARVFPWMDRPKRVAVPAITARHKRVGTNHARGRDDEDC
jgi:hypothetical protein